MLRWCNVFARLRNYCTSCYVDVTFLHACGNFFMLRWCSVLARLHKDESCRNPTNWSLLEPPQKKMPQSDEETALAQPSMLDSGIESISGSIATTCLSETWRPHARWKKRLLKLFVVWCRNWSLKKWQNVRRFGTWMSKTHGCVNPCYLVFLMGKRWFVMGKISMFDENMYASQLAVSNIYTVYWLLVWSIFLFFP